MSATVDALTAIVGLATRAPSMHNTQPWRFRVVPASDTDLEGAVITVYHDRSRDLPVADPTGWAARIACGAAGFAVRLGIAAHGHRAHFSVLPDPADPTLAVRIRVGPRRTTTPEERALYAALPQRRSNRYPFHDTPAAPGSGETLRAAAHAEAAWLDVVDDPRRRVAVADVIQTAQRRLAADRAYQDELAAWVRAGGGVHDGVPPQAGGPSPEPYDLLAFRNFGDAPRAFGRDFEPNPLVAVLGTTSDTPADQVRAGMALHRVLLAGTAAGLASSMLSQPIELPDTRVKLCTALGRNGGYPQMVLRFGYGVRAPATPRRPVAEVLDVVPADDRGI